MLIFIYFYDEQTSTYLQKENTNYVAYSGQNLKEYSSVIMNTK